MFLFCLFRYENPEIALNCGAMLRECIRHETLARIILYSPDLYKFFDYVEVSTFDISSDAFATFKVNRYSVCIFKFHLCFKGPTNQTQSHMCRIPGAKL